MTLSLSWKICTRASPMCRGGTLHANEGKGTLKKECALERTVLIDLTVHIAQFKPGAATVAVSCTDDSTCHHDVMFRHQQRAPPHEYMHAIGALLSQQVCKLSMKSLYLDKHKK
jgi:hypothetical protein